MYRIVASVLTVALVLPILTVRANWQDTVWCSKSDDIHYGSHGFAECPPEDPACESDKLGYEAILRLHGQIDDDHNGNLDRTESDEFIRDEMHYEAGSERQTNLHGSDDLISVSDLWHLWTKSPVYNWTTDDVVNWLTVYVELPQYAHAFRVNSVDGRTLPRIAVMNGQYLGSILGIKSSSHKTKLSFKAMDVVLFGPAKNHNYVKDVALIASLIVAVAGCWLAYVQHVYSQSRLRKVMKDLATLQASEDSLQQLQCKLEMAEQEQKNVSEQKHHLEQQLKAEIAEAKAEAERLRETRETTDEEMSRIYLAEEELVQVRRALKKAERELEEKEAAPVELLQQWLQLSYEIENKHFMVKREVAERQLAAAKEMCEKIGKKKTAFLGSFRIAHTTSMDDTDKIITNARSALEDMRVDMQERSSRWCQIERICNFNVIINPGLLFLENKLRQHTSYSQSSGNLPTSGSMSPLVAHDEDTDDDRPPGYLAATAMQQHQTNKAQGDPLRQRQTVPAPLINNSGSLGALNALDGLSPNADTDFNSCLWVSASMQNRAKPSLLLDKLKIGSPRVAPLDGDQNGSGAGVEQVKTIGAVLDASPLGTPPPAYGVIGGGTPQPHNQNNNRVRFKLGESSAFLEHKADASLSLSDSSLSSSAATGVLSAMTSTPSPSSGLSNVQRRKMCPRMPFMPPPSPLAAMTDEDSETPTDGGGTPTGDEPKKRKKKTLLPKLLKSPIADRGRVY